MEFLAELWGFLRVRKKFWLLPIILVLLLFGGISVVLQTLDTYSVATDVNMAFINGTLPVMAFAAIIIHLRDIVRLIRTPAGEFNTAPKTE